MPLSPVGNNTYLTDVDVRIWLRDNDPDANLLLDDFEFSTEEIRSAMTHTVDYWNETPPSVGSYDYNRFPYRYALLRGTAANLLFMAAHRFRRNQLNYSAGGLTVDDQNKYQQYDSAGARLWEEYKVWVAQTKKSINAEQGWGTIN
jgi:hypothetical protein